MYLISKSTNVLVVLNYIFGGLLQEFVIVLFCPNQSDRAVWHYGHAPHFASTIGTHWFKHHLWCFHKDWLLCMCMCWVVRRFHVHPSSSGIRVVGIDSRHLACSWIEVWWKLYLIKEHGGWVYTTRACMVCKQAHNSVCCHRAQRCEWFGLSRLLRLQGDFEYRMKLRYRIACSVGWICALKAWVYRISWSCQSRHERVCRCLGCLHLQKRLCTVTCHVHGDADHTDTWSQLHPQPQSDS